MRMRVNLKPVFGAAALLGAGLMMAPASAATFVYVGNADSQDISILELKSNGDLTPVETAAVPGPAKPGSSLPLAVSPDRKRLYAGLRNEPYSVVTFSIDARTGKLKPVGPGPLADSMAYIATDRSGQFLFSASYGGNKIAVNPIDRMACRRRQQIMPTQPMRIASCPTHRTATCCTPASAAISCRENRRQTGKLTPNDPPSMSVRPRPARGIWCFRRTASSSI